jgi:hypothetical protein
MECRDIQDRLNDYTEGFLKEREIRQIEEHLDQCRGCSTVLEELRKAGQILKDMDQIEPPPWLATRIMAEVAEIEAKGSEHHGLLSWLFRPLFIKIPLQALGLFFVAALAILVYRENASQYNRVAPKIQTPDAVSRHEETPPAKSAFDDHAPEADKSGKSAEAVGNVGTALGAVPLGRRTEEGDGGARLAEKPIVTEQKGMQVAPAAPTQETRKRKDEIAPEKQRSFEIGTDSKSLRPARAPANEGLAEPRAVPALKGARDGRDTLLAIENLLASFGAKNVVKRTEPQKTSVTASLPTHRLSQLSDMLSSRYPDVRVTQTQVSAGEAEQGYEAIIIEIPAP